MVIDSHIHVFNRSVGGAEENFPLWPNRRTSRWGAGEEDLLRQMDEVGIDKAFLISYTPVDVMAHYSPEKRDHMLAVFQHYLSKDHAIRVWSEHRDRFFWFSDSVDPRVPGYVERAEQDLDRGASGLKLLPLFVHTDMGDPRWRPIFELLQKKNKPCIIDLSWWYTTRLWFSPSTNEKYDSYTDYVRGFGELAADFRDVKVQLAHFGTPKGKGGDESAMDEVINFVQAHPNLSCDLAAYQQSIEEGEPYPYWTALKVVEKLVEGLGAERICWGTDWPYLGVQPYGEIIRAIREAPFLDAKQVEQILGLNALRFVT